MDYKPDIKKILYWLNVWSGQNGYGEVTLDGYFDRNDNYVCILRIPGLITTQGAADTEEMPKVYDDAFLRAMWSLSDYLERHGKYLNIFETALKTINKTSNYDKVNGLIEVGLLKSVRYEFDSYNGEEIKKNPVIYYTSINGESGSITTSLNGEKWKEDMQEYVAGVFLQRVVRFGFGNFIIEREQ